MHPTIRRTALIRVTLLAVLAVLFTAASSARADAVFTFTQVGTDIVGTLSGSLNLTGATSIGNTPSYNPYLGAHTGQVIATPGDITNGLTGTVWNATGPTSFGTHDSPLGTATGGVFEVDAFDVILPTNYAGGALTNTLTISNETFANLGITPGDYVYTITGTHSTVTLDFVAATTPLPSSAWGGLALLGGLGMMTILRRRFSAAV